MAKKSFIPWLIHIFTSVLFGILFLFLATNILFAISLPEFGRVIDGDKESVVGFMKHVGSISAFTYLFPEMKSTFADHDVEVYKDDRERNAMITKLEKNLEINPKSRDVLYSLYLLYDKSGNDGKAAHYLRLAQEVDPKIGR